MSNRRRVSKFIVGVVMSGAIVACADSLAPDRSPDVIPNPGGVSAKDPTPNPSSDTTLPPDRLRGMVVATALDSTGTWHPVESVRLEAAQRDTRTGAMVVLASASSDAAGRFVFG